MRQELDAKVLYSQIEQKLNHAFGKDFMARFKFYIKKFYERNSDEFQQGYDSPRSTITSREISPLAKLAKLAEMQSPTRGTAAAAGNNGKKQ